MFSEINNMLSLLTNDKTFLNKAEVEIQILTGWFDKTNRIKKLKRKLRYNGN